MIELKMGARTMDLPYMVRIPNVTEKMFSQLVDEDTRAELIDGVLIVHSPASYQHDDVGGFIRPLMRSFAEVRKRGRVLGPDSLARLVIGRKVAPDWYFVAKHRLSLFRRKLFWGTPDFLGEILSSSNREYDLEKKRPMYQKARAKEIWFVDQENRQVLVDRLRGHTYQSDTVSTGKLASLVLEGFWINVDWLWKDPLPDLLGCLLQILS